MQSELDPGDQVQAQLAEAPTLPRGVPPNVGTSDDDPPLWLAVWRPSSSIAYSVDVSADELEPYRRSLRSAGNAVAGPFTSQRQAQGFAIEKLAAAMKGRKRGNCPPAAAP